MPEHCEQAQICREYAKCSSRAGVCEVGDDGDCRESKLCENEGRCAKHATEATCIATSQADCEASDDCVHHDRGTGELISRKNRCTLDGDRCVATSCEDTTQCEEKMCCELVDGRCVQR